MRGFLRLIFVLSCMCVNWCRFIGSLMMGLS